MNRLEVLDGSGTAQIEEVLASAKIASAMPLALGDVRKTVLDAGALAETLSPASRREELAQPVLEPLVLANADRTSVLRTGHRAA